MIQPKKEILEMQPYSPPVSGRQKFLRLDFNENTKGFFSNGNTFLKIPIERVSTYPEYETLTKKIAKYTKIRTKNLLPTNGSDTGIKLVFDLFIRKGDEIITIVPAYSMFKVYAQMFGAKIKEIEFGKNFSFPEKEVLKILSSKTKMAVLINPNSPTGTSISQKTIEKILKKAKNAVVLVDEAYYDFYGKTAQKLLKKYSNLVILRTFSKSFGIAGIRFGYVLADEKTISLLKKIQGPYDVNYLAEFFLDKALSNQKYFKNYIKEVRKNRAEFSKKLKKLGFVVYPSQGNYLLINFGKSKNFFLEQLKKTGILIRKIEALENCARATIGTRKQMKLLEKELKRIALSPVLIFDIDGVLIDVSKSYRKAVQKTCKFFTNQKISLKEIQEFKNKGNLSNDWKLCQAIIEAKGKKVAFKKIVNKFQRLYVSKNFNGLILNEKFLMRKKFLKKLKENYRTAIVTGRPREEAEFALKRFGVFDLFDEIVCMEDSKKEKPNPEKLLLCMKNLKAKNGFYFGDTIDNMVAAKRAKIVPIGVLSPQDKSLETKKLLEKKGAKKVLNSINEIWNVLK